MLGRFKLWIGIIVLLLIMSFLTGFNPIRQAPDGFRVESTFRYVFAEPLEEAEAQPEAVKAELTSLIRERVPDLDYVEVLSPQEVEVGTFATTEEVAERHQQDILAALQSKYAGVTPVALEQEEEKPLWELGSLAIYRPQPQVRLGLDLQGGAHVVLIATPETTMAFRSPEDQPLVRMEQAPSAETPEARTAALMQTPEDLKRNIMAALARIGAEEDTVEVDTVSPTAVVVKTEAQDEQEAERQEAATLSYLRNAYPGVDVTLEKRDSVFIEPGTAEKVLNVIERRLYAMTDIREPTMQTQGNDRVIVELPGVRDPDRVTNLLGKTAKLEFVMVPDRYEPPGGEVADYSMWTDKFSRRSVPWEQVYLESEVEFSGRDLQSNAQVQPGQGMDLVVWFEMRTERKEDFRRFTARNVGRYMAIVLDEEPQMAPVIRSEIPGEGIIEGNFSPQEARDLQLLLNAGALPIPLEIAENRTMSATLGADTVRQSLVAGIIGVVAVMIFMVGYYRLPGLLADFALTVYLLLLLAVLAISNSTLTLPGIAGLIMSLGMAVDANILIFERVKEELWGGKSPRSAVEAGFDRAWTAILDANITTLIGAGVLYFLGSSAIKSFAVTLWWGTLVSFFTAVTLSRWLLTMLAHTPYGQRLATYGVRREQ